MIHFLSPMFAVQRVLPSVLVDVIRRQPLSPEKIDFAWRTAVGAALARVTTIHLRPGGTLFVRVSDVRWKTELDPSLALVRDRLVPLLGEKVVRRIEVRVGPPSPGDTSAGDSSASSTGESSNGTPRNDTRGQTRADAPQPAARAGLPSPVRSSMS